LGKPVFLTLLVFLEICINDYITWKNTNVDRYIRAPMIVCEAEVNLNFTIFGNLVLEDE
jgi:hypothetical protein